jgi:hypothetical protein
VLLRCRSSLAVAARALRVGAAAVTACCTEGPTRHATVTCGTRQWSLQWTECACVTGSYVCAGGRNLRSIIASLFRILRTVSVGPAELAVAACRLWAHPRVRSLHGPCLPAQDRLTTNMWRWVWDVLPRVRRDMYPWKSPNLANYTRVKEARA